MSVAISCVRSTYFATRSERRYVSHKDGLTCCGLKNDSVVITARLEMKVSIAMKLKIFIGMVALVEKVKTSDVQ